MSGTEIYSDTFPAFGGNCDLVFTGMQAVEAKEILQKIKKEVRQLESVLDISGLTTDVQEQNHSAVNEWMEVNPVLMGVLSLCSDFYSMSNGAFDVTVQPLYEFWENNPDPGVAEIEKAREQCGFNQMELDIENNRLRFLKEGMKLDLGTIEKAYAADVIKSMLIENQITNCIVSFDENVILALGEHPSGNSWPIGIRNIEQPEEFLHVFNGSDQFIVTAGTVFIDPETMNIKENRVISPESGFPVSGKKTVSVCGASATLCAFIAYSWLILPGHDQEIIAEQLGDMEIFEAEYLEDDIKTKQTILNDEQNTES